MNFVKTFTGELIPIRLVARIYSITGEDKAVWSMAKLDSGEVIRLCRSYSMEAMTRAFCPVNGNGR